MAELVKAHSKILVNERKELAIELEIFARAFPENYEPPPGFYFEVNDNSPIVQDDINLFDYNVQNRVNDFVAVAISQDGRVNALYSTPSIYTDAKYALSKSWPLKTDDYFSLQVSRIIVPKWNQQLLKNNSAPKEGFTLPFILVQTNLHATVEIEISEDMQLVHLDFNRQEFMIKKSMVKMQPMLLMKVIDHTKNGESLVIGLMLRRYIAKPVSSKGISINDIHLSSNDLEMYVDLAPFFNPSPYVVPEDMSLTKIYNLFCQPGLRHIFVVPRASYMIGVITRKDLLIE
ncbi:hypothetical protein CRYUN_Cryun41cG0055400 [Craigia yunnanensis]